VSSDEDASWGVIAQALDGFRILLVPSDTGYDATGEVLHRSEDAAVDEVTLDLGDPELVTGY